MKLEFKNKYVASTGSIYYNVFCEGRLIRRIRIANHFDRSSLNQITYFADNPEKVPINKLKEWCLQELKIFNIKLTRKKKYNRHENKRFSFNSDID